MGGFDNATWQALGLALTVVGLGLSVLVWMRKGPARGIRWAAWSLLPLAAGLTGVLRLGGEISESVLTWATRLVFSPVVWLGLVVAGVSAALFGLSAWMTRRADRRGVAGQSDPPVAAPPARRGLGTRGKKPAQASTSGDEDLADVEDILRKHGIT